MSVARPDEPCPFCGFDLRGTPKSGRCPECGAILDARREELRARNSSRQRAFLLTIVAILSAVAGSLITGPRPHDDSACCGALVAFTSIAFAVGAIIASRRSRSRLFILLLCAIAMMLNLVTAMNLF